MVSRLHAQRTFFFHQSIEGVFFFCILSFEIQGLAMGSARQTNELKRSLCDVNMIHAKQI